ncbi:hypothetical protein [Micromonospora sp. NPDC005367]|uniref:hypothetical protein n=1 Tax=Micromonospora sp. NPDC005367 TaxID=3155590 RepID=UPI0033BCA73C
MRWGIRGAAQGEKDNPLSFVRHTVGNALVLHVREEISPEAQSLALSMVEDSENDLVVIDLAEGLPVASWESMAGVLPRRRKGIRLVACGRHHNAAAMAGQWLSERLGRTVIAPDGDLIRGGAGALFVHSTPGSGWVRFRPGRSPAWDSKRYPTPLWDRAVTENWTPSSTGEIEPLPGGVWIHDTRELETVATHRKLLTGAVPCQPETMTVLLGCPGTAPLPLDDVVRFWRVLDADDRSRVRFVQYGDVRLPEGESFGQALADLLESSLVCYTGLPVGSPRRYDVRTVRPDGSLGWPPFARRLGYEPRAHPNSKALRPVVLNHRPPLRWTEEIAPRVYWYAPDAVVEVVQAGLWVRSAEEPANAERVRAAVLDPEGATVIFDDTVEAHSTRMRELATDLAARLDERAGTGSALLPSSVLVPGLKPVGRAQAVLDLDAVARVTTSPAPAVAKVTPPEPAAVEATVAFEIPAPPGADRSATPERPQPSARPVSARAQVPAPTLSPPKLPPPPAAAPPPPEGLSPSAPVSVAEPPQPHDEVATRPRVLDPGDSIRFAVLRPADIASAGPQPVPQSPVPPVLVPPAPVAPPVAPVSPAVEPVAAVEPVVVADPVAPAAPVAPVQTFEVPEPVQAAGIVESVQAAGPTGEAEVAGPPSAAERVRTDASESPVPVRIQPVPTAGASALLPNRALDDERSWLRRTLSREFDMMASSVSRIMSEHPGMQHAGLSADDVLADSVAVRLYLTSRGERIDVGLRSGSNGPHVPFARCVVSGLSRLPSFRGATMFRTSPREQEWELYRRRKLVTDWSFVNVLTQPYDGQEGDTDVLIWSMTARRTTLLEPEGGDRIEDRALFLPGTSFKILELRAPAESGRGVILMREIGSNEIDDNGRVDPNRFSLDDLAVTTLKRSIERWAGMEAKKRIGADGRGRFSVLPGLERKR